MKAKGLLILSSAIFVLSSIFIIVQLTGEGDVDHIVYRNDANWNKKNQELLDSAEVLIENSNPTASLHLLKELENRYKLSGDTEFLDEIYRMYSSSYSRLKMYDKAISFRKEAIRVLDHEKYPEELENDYSKLGRGYLFLNNIDTAEFYYEKQFEVIKKHNLKNKYSNYYISKSVVTSMRDDARGALKWVYLALKHSKDLSEEDLGDKAVLINNNLSHLYNELSIIDSAEHFNQTALAEAKRLEDDYLIGACYNGSGQMFINKGEFNNAILEFEKAIEHLKRYELKNEGATGWLLEEAFVGMANAYTGQGDLKKAYEWLEKSKEEQSSLVQVQFAEQLKNVDDELGVIDKLRSYERLKLNEANYQWRIKLLIPTFVVMIWSVVVILLIGRKQLKEERANVQIKEEERAELMREITNHSLDVERRNDFINNLRKELKTLSRSSVDDKASEQIKNITSRISQFISSLDSAESINGRVENLNQSFYLNLKKKYPNLSEKDAKLCGMIRLGLTSKEMAAVMNIESKSVEMARYRLRKKMELEANEKIQDVLNDI